MESKDFLYLFRGDNGLPMGLPPISPCVRQMLHQGRNLEDASTAIKGIVDYMDIEYTMAHDFVNYSSINHFDNPLVSTTDDFRRALYYASSTEQLDDSGYISVLKVKENRAFAFSDYIKTDISRKDREFGVIAGINKNEILYQIPISEIFRLIPKSDMKSDQIFDHFRDIFYDDKFKFRPRIPFELHCPSCSGELYCYLSDCLGTNDNDLSMHPLNEIKSEDAHLIYVANYLWSIVVKCMHCGKYIFNPIMANMVPIKLLSYHQKRDKVFIEVQNMTNEYIDHISLKLSFKKDGKVQRTFLRGQLKSQPFNISEWDIRILPQSIANHIIKIDINIEVIDLRITFAHFSSGRIWVPIYDLEI